MNASWFRYFFVVSVVVGALLVSLGFHEIGVGQQHQDANTRQLHSLVLKNEVLATQSRNLAAQVAASHKRELHNRTSNVAVWCGAINEGRKEGIRLHHGEAAYKLKLLDCKALESHTLSSGEASSLK